MNIKIEKRINPEDVLQQTNLDSAWDMLQKWQLQELKDQQAQIPEFEIIQPKLLK